MIQPGLERIGLLLKNVQLPWKTIHVAGTNGKGSICAYASALLTRRTIRNGRFTSPHIVHRWDCITINDVPVDETVFRQVEEYFLRLNERERIGASEFELLTATAFKIFTDHKVKVGVVEVGMGGKLDATNILENQVVSVISKIARDHQDFLGTTLSEIAAHKAGILRPNIPYVVNPCNEWNTHEIIEDYAHQIGAGPRLHGDTEELKEQLFRTVWWEKFATTLRPFQRDNAVLAYLAVVEAIKSLDLPDIEDFPKLVASLTNKRLPGRLHPHACPAILGPGRKILVDGAHNPDAARALQDYVSQNLRRPGKSSRSLPVTWVVAMTSGKDARQYLGTLLEPNDYIVTTTFDPVDGMPWVMPMDPAELLRIAQDVQPSVTGVSIPYCGAFRAICAAKYLTKSHTPIVLTGSLYFVSTFLREKERWVADSNATEVKAMEIQERNRVNESFSSAIESFDSTSSNPSSESAENERQQLQDEIIRLDREMQRLKEEEDELMHEAQGKKLAPTHIFTTPNMAKSPLPSPKSKSLDDVEEVHKELETSTPGKNYSTDEIENAPAPNIRKFLSSKGMERGMYKKRGKDS